MNDSLQSDDLLSSFLCIPDRIMNANPYSIHTNTHLVHSFVILAVFLCSESGFFSVSVSQLCCEETFFIPHTVVRVFFTSHASPFFGSLSDVRRLFPTFLNFSQLSSTDRKNEMVKTTTKKQQAVLKKYVVPEFISLL